MVRAVFRNPSLPDHQNPVGLANRGQPVRDDEARAPFQHLVDRGLNLLLGLRIHRRRGFIEHENARIRQNGAGKRHQLLLAGREAVAALADLGIIAALHAGNKVVRVHQPRGLLDLLIGRLQPGIADVRPQRAAEQVRRLQHVAQIRLQPRQRPFPTGKSNESGVRCMR